MERSKVKMAGNLEKNDDHWINQGNAIECSRRIRSAVATSPKHREEQ